MTPKPPKPKKCKQCKTPFMPTTTTQTLCGWKCATAFAEALAAKREARAKRDEAKAHREAKVKAMTRRDWLPIAQDAFNKYIRLRDADKPCISCGRVEVEWTRGGAWDCGHFLSRGAYPELRFEELNAAKQCKSCNGGSGKYARKNHTVSQSYRVNLIERIGLASVEWLEGPHEPKKYTVDELKAIKEKYTKLAKELLTIGEKA